MNDSLHEFVQSNERWFRGRLPETDESLDAAEAALQLRIPRCVRWLLRDYGYWHATGIESLEESVKNTLAARKHVALPHRYMVLYDHQDAGVVLTDTQSDASEAEPPVYHIGWEDIPDHIIDGVSYPTFLNYVRQMLSDGRDFMNDADVDYDPSRYRTT